MDHELTESLAYARHLLTEHRRLHQMLLRVEESWPTSESARRDAVVIARLISSVKELRKAVAKHFAEEEAGGVLEEAVSRDPDLGPEESRLVEEHAALLADFDAVIAQLQSASDAGELPPDVEQQFRQLTNRLHAHETAENRILARGFRIEVN